MISKSVAPSETSHPPFKPLPDTAPFVTRRCKACISINYRPVGISLTELYTCSGNDDHGDTNALSILLICTLHSVTV